MTGMWRKRGKGLHLTRGGIPCTHRHTGQLMWLLPVFFFFYHKVLMALGGSISLRNLVNVLLSRAGSHLSSSFV